MQIECIFPKKQSLVWTLNILTIYCIQMNIDVMNIDFIYVLHSIQTWDVKLSEWS